MPAGRVDWLQGLGFGVSGFGFWVSGFGFRVARARGLGFEFRV